MDALGTTFHSQYHAHFAVYFMEYAIFPASLFDKKSKATPRLRPLSLSTRRRQPALCNVKNLHRKPQCVLSNRTLRFWTLKLIAKISNPNKTVHIAPYT